MTVLEVAAGRCLRFASTGRPHRPIIHHPMHPQEKRRIYQQCRSRILAMITGEDDEIAVMATVVAELFHAFAHFHWVGYYRVVRPGLLKVGPYQGGHGCLSIPFGRGVCGRCARDKTTQVVADVTRLPYHIACSSATRSEIVVPLLGARGRVCAVLDIDSDLPAAFDALDREELETLAADVRGVLYPGVGGRRLRGGAAERKNQQEERAEHGV